MQAGANKVIDLVYDERLKSYTADFQAIKEIHKIPSLSGIISNENKDLEHPGKKVVPRRVVPIRAELALTANQKRIEEQDLIEARASAFNIIMTILGALLGLCGASIAWISGLELIPVLAVYCAIGSATTLGTIVVSALLSNMRF